MKINLTEYATIPEQIFQFLADWQEYENTEEYENAEDSRSYRKARSFFKDNPSKRTYIVECPTSRLEEWNQGYLPELIKIAREFHVRIITWQKKEAKRFYLERVNADATNFAKAKNPFYVIDQYVIPQSSTPAPL